MVGNDLKLKPLSSSLGAEVTGVDLGQNISAEIAQKLSLARSIHSPSVQGSGRKRS